MVSLALFFLALLATPALAKQGGGDRKYPDCGAPFCAGGEAGARRMMRGRAWGGKIEQQGHGQGQEVVEKAGSGA